MKLFFFLRVNQDTTIVTSNNALAFMVMLSKKIKKEALELSQKERAQLAHMLIDSLNPKAEFESEEDWSKEIKHRIKQYEKGISSSTSWEEVKKKGQDLLNK